MTPGKDARDRAREVLATTLEGHGSAASAQAVRASNLSGWFVPAHAVLDAMLAFATTEASLSDGDGELEQIRAHMLHLETFAGYHQRERIREILRLLDAIKAPDTMLRSQERVSDGVHAELWKADEQVAMLRSALERERERCARVADDEITRIFSTSSSGHGSNTARRIRDAIRALSTQPKGEG